MASREHSRAGRKLPFCVASPGNETNTRADEMVGPDDFLHKHGYKSSGFTDGKTGTPAAEVAHLKNGDAATINGTDGTVYTIKKITRKETVFGEKPTDQHDVVREIISIRLQLSSWGITKPFTFYGAVHESCNVDEDVKLVKEFLNTSMQVVDIGNVGWFHLYSAVAFDTTVAPPYWTASSTVDAFDAFVERLRAKDSFFKKVHTKDEYTKNKGDKLLSPERKYVFDPIVTGTKIQTAALAASAALQDAGFSKQQQVLIVAPIEGRVNQNTGGGIGGYASFAKHGIVVNRSEVANASSDWLKEIIVHEWAHQYWYRMDKGRKAFFKEWFDANVIATGTQSFSMNKEKVDRIQRLAWKGFSRAVAQARAGLTPDDFMELKRKQAKFAETGETEVFKETTLRYFTAQDGEVIGELKRPMKDSEGKEHKKGEKVIVMVGSGIKDFFVFVRETVNKQPFAGAQIHPDKPIPGGENPAIFTFDELLDTVDTDIEGTTNLKVNKEKGSPNLTTELKSVADQFNPKFSNTWYLGLEAAERQLNYTTKGKYKIVSYKAQAIVDYWTTKAKEDDLAFDPEKRFREAIAKFGSFEPPSEQVAQTLTTAEGNDLKSYIASKGVTPSAYAASNVDELWAETVVYTVMKKTGVSKALRAVLNRVLQGNVS